MTWRFNRFLSQLSLRLYVLVLSGCCLQGSFNSIAQEMPSLRGTVVYGSFCGPLASITINAECRIFATPQRVGFLMTGFGTWQRDTRYMAIPLGLTLVRGSGNNHRELGFTFLYNQGVEGPYRGTQGSYDREWNKSLFFFPSIGYRYQRPDGGFFFRIYYGPGIKIGEFSETDPQNANGFRVPGTLYMINFGFGAGYFFNRKQ